MSAVPVRGGMPVVIGAGAPKRAIFLLDAWPSFEQQEPMAHALEDAGWECWFMPLAGAQFAGDAARRVRLWPLDAAPSTPGGGAKPTPAAQRGLRVIASRLVRGPGMSAARDLVLAVRTTKEWRRCRALARARLAALGPDCVVTAQDRIPSALPVVAAARDLGIPIVLAVCAGLFMPDGCAYLRKDNPDVRLDPGPGTRWGQLILNRLVGRLAPDQVYASRWGRMLYQSAGWHLAAWLTGLTLPSFWYQGARFADAVVVSGNDEQLVCRRAGIEPAKVAAIGSPALQLQYQRRRDCERIRGELGVRRIEPLLVVAVPQFWEHGMMDEELHFAFIDRFFAMLSKRKATVILSLHPKMERERYLFRAKSAGLRLADRPLIQIMSAADLFVACAYSTTIRWAMAVGIPCINLDLWDLNESTYRDLPDYPSVRSWDDAEHWLDAHLAGGRPEPDATKPPMGLICDGRFGAQFVALVERLVRDRRCAAR